MANGLINLQTDLKSLRYGNDKPYITKNIGDSPGSQIGMEVQHRIDDTSRIAQMLIDKPGIKYLLHEAELQQVNIANKIKNRGNKTIAGAVLGQLGNTLIGTAKILGSTLAQVPVNGTGLHFLKGFRTDTYLQPTNGNQASGFAQFFGAGGVEGAPLALQGKPIEGVVESKFGERIGSTDFKINVESALDYDEKVNTLIPNISTNIYAKQGTTIIEDNVGVDGWKPYTSTGVKEQFVDRDTNKIVSQSKFADPALQNKPRIAPSGSVVSTTVAIPNPVTGDPLDIPGIQTTATPGIITSQNLIVGSKLNKDVKYDLGDSGNDGKQKYTADNTYTGTSTAINIGTVLDPKSTAGVGTPGRIYIGGKDVGGVSTDTLLKEDSYVTFAKYVDERGITDLASFPSPTDIGELYRVSSSQEIAKIPDGSIQDFRQKFGDTYSFDYNNIDIKRETRVNLGDQGRKKAKGFYTSYSTKDDLAIDKLNELDISDSRIDGTQAARDLAKLYFEIITPDGSKFLHFRAFIDSIDDSYNADWQGSKYVGRAENFYTYNGFERDISISFKIAAATRSEMKPLYRKMVYLASSTAPTYGGQGFMRGSLAKITVGSYLSQIPGVITSVKFNLIDGMPWEIAMQNPEAGTDDDVQELPMGLQCNVSFKAIHDFAPQTGLQHYFTNPNPVNGAKPFF
jgi:hypothetical protein